MIDTNGLILAHNILNEIKIPHTLLASTLLGIYRDGEPIGPILEFAVLEKDLTPKKLDKLKSNKNYHGFRDGHLGISIYDLKDLYEAMFEIHILRFIDKYAYFNLTGDDVLVFPKGMWLKKNWKVLKWRDMDYNTPGDIEKYLELQYGEDWKTPQGSQWSSSPSHKKLKDIGLGSIKNYHSD